MPDELITDPTVLFTKNTKRTGEFSEAGFLHRAEGYGFNLAKPWGDSERYDFILDSGSRLWKVQVKGTEVLRARGYEVRVAFTTSRPSAALIPVQRLDHLHQDPSMSWSPFLLVNKGNRSDQGPKAKG